MRLLAQVLFYGYVGLLAVAGAWGVFGARLDHRILFGFDLGDRRGPTEASMVGQYRFLRAIECGFGAFALLFHREIFTMAAYNHLFLATMAGGVAARIVSRLLDGNPRPVFYLFFAWEAVGVVIIFLYTRNLVTG